MQARNLPPDQGCTCSRHISARGRMVTAAERVDGVAGKEGSMAVSKTVRHFPAGSLHSMLSGEELKSSSSSALASSNAAKKRQSSLRHLSCDMGSPCASSQEMSAWPVTLFTLPLKWLARLTAG